MRVDEANKLAPYEREVIDELRKVRMALEGVLKIWEKMAE